MLNLSLFDKKIVAAMTSINTFYNRVTHEVNTTPALKKFFCESESGEIPTLFQITANSLGNLSVDISKMHKTIQQKALSSQYNFSNWNETIPLCLPKQSKKHTDNLLAKHLDEMPSEPDKFLLEFFFDTMFAGASPEIKNEIITLKNRTQPLNDSIKIVFEKIAENVLDSAAKLLANKVFILALRTLFITSFLYTNCMHILPKYYAIDPKILVNILKSFFIYADILIKNYPIASRLIPTTLLLLPRLNADIKHPPTSKMGWAARLLVYPLILFTGRELILVTLVASSVFVYMALPQIWFISGCEALDIFFKNIPNLVNKMRAISAKSKEARAFRHCTEARNLWVQSVLANRQKQRLKFEKYVVA